MKLVHGQRPVYREPMRLVLPALRDFKTTRAGAGTPARSRDPLEREKEETVLRLSSFSSSAKTSMSGATTRGARVPPTRGGPFISRDWRTSRCRGTAEVGYELPWDRSSDVVWFDAHPQYVPR